MTAILATPLSQIELTPGSAMQITGVTWESYVALLSELGENRATRVTYDHGVLEIRMPGPLHEVINQVLAAIILALAEELDLEFNNLGSIRMNRPDLAKGIEPDSCFYIQSAQAGQGMGANIPQDLPPDLALEVDIANRSDSKLPIYQAMGVPEVWLCRQEELTILILQAGKYQHQATSRAFPAVSTEQLNQWIQLRKTGTDLTVIRAVRQFCRNL
jgi:Uma2 family endonuclease